MLRTNQNKKLLVLMTVIICSSAFIATAQADWPQQDKLLPADGAADDWFGESVSVSGDYAIVGARHDDDNGSNSGSAYIFYYDGMGWSQQAKLLAADGTSGDGFGHSVSMSGNYAIVGAFGDDDNGSDSGSAYIFKRSDVPDDPNWYQQAKLLASDGAAGDHFGDWVSMSGDYAIVGVYMDDDNGTNSGSAYIFKRDGTNWSQQAKLLASDGAAGDCFGDSSISGDTAIVGAGQYYTHTSGTGKAYIFKFDGTSWVEQAKLLASDGAASDYFGASVSISGDYAIVGASADDDNGFNSGSAYIFKRDGTSWSEQAKLLASDGAADSYFGALVSISGDYAIIGAHLGDGNEVDSGSAYIFKRYGETWSEQAKLVASDGAEGDYFGIFVSISGDYAIAGAYSDDDNGSISGSAYIFKRVCPTADISGDCRVDWVDFATMAGQWLQDN